MDNPDFALQNPALRARLIKSLRDLIKSAGVKPELCMHAFVHEFCVRAKFGFKEIIFLSEEKLGFWEEQGYSNTAEPWYDDRYS